MDEQRAASIKGALNFWQAHSPGILTREGGRQAVQNVCGFFTTLDEWSASMNKAQTAELRKEAT